MSDPSDISLEREREIFLAALERAPGSDRQLYLDEACRGEAGLREQVELLLKNHLEDDFLEAAALASEPEHPLLPAAEEAGTVIGRYKLREKIGEGGCGIVYVAEQEQPVRRRVALKIIKLGMDTRNVVARFESERQALALMDHPNIAKVFDAGATETGRPYFVMELVRGVKITDYCDQNRLSTRERLELFIKVCKAVQHAHQRGIIHRDLKPSNILVTVNDPDGVGMPKVIDFGIAKATEGKLGDLTVYTELNQFIGTPAYMSPEQATMTSAHIDTRSDIYSLGVLLYELLTGHTPFDTKELIALGPDDLRRTIREKEPLRPSTRLGGLNAGELTTTAQRRASEPLRLIRVLRGDLDWIAMKCLEKDRVRRYENANALAMDLERHLNEEPIAARPASAAYRLHRLARRNKLLLVAVGSMALALAAALAWIMEDLRAWRAEASRIDSTRQLAALKKRQFEAALEGEARSLAAQGKPEEAEAKYREALSACQELWTNQPLKWRECAEGFVDVLRREGKYADAERVLRDLLTDSTLTQPEIAQLLWDRADILARRGLWKEASADFSRLVGFNPGNHWYHLWLAPLLVKSGDVEGYRRHCAQVLALFGDTGDPLIAERMAKICLIMPISQLDLEAVARLANKAVTSGQGHPFFPYFRLTEGLAEYRLGRFESAADLMREVLADRGQSANRDAQACFVLAMALYRSGDNAASRAALDRGEQIITTELPDQPTGDVGDGWNDRLVMQALLQEAKSLISPAARLPPEAGVKSLSSTARDTWFSPPVVRDGLLIWPRPLQANGLYQFCVTS